MTAGLPRTAQQRDRSHSPRHSGRIRTLVADGLSGEFMTPTANLAAAAADADHPAAPAAEVDSFVLNLCSSTTPMALAQTELPELKRFTFFVSRRFEEGRERFRLHMGFFASLAEAEEWLGVVREVYPGAWAGEAPGKKLRARATEAAATQARHAVGPQATAAAQKTAPPQKTAAPQKSAPPQKSTAPQKTAPPQKSAAPVMAAVRPPAAAPVARLVSAQPAPPKVPTLVPTLHPPVAASTGAAAPAPAAAPARPVVALPAKASAQPALKRSAAPAPAARPVASAAAHATTQHPAASQPTPAARPAAAAELPPRAGSAVPAAGGQRPPARAAAPARPAGAATASAPAGQVKASAAAARSAPQAASRGGQQPAKKPIFADSNVKEVLAALDSPEDGTGETRVMPAPAGLGDGTDDSALTDTQVLRFLEIRRTEDGAARGQSSPDADADTGISLLKPDDTGTRRALKEAVSHNEAVSFAVQLQWSVQPVELEKVPPLAIFSAYTLYSVEGSREGRKWYGLRLGFFSDAISAKQVAYYVRSEFNSVAVVPVSPQERERATEDNQRFSGVTAPRKRRQNEDHGITLIDSDEAPRATPAQAAPAASAPPPATGQPAPTRAVRKGGGKVGASERRTPQTLEETLEILGANDLAIDDATADALNDTGVRHLRVEFQKNTPFSRLLERLSERVRKT
jgi:hypothetical protein